MEQLRVHCPKCHVTLRVPVDAAGRWARCPACKERFQLKSKKQMMEASEEAISSWLEDDKDESAVTTPDPTLPPIPNATGTPPPVAAPAPATARPPASTAPSPSAAKRPSPGFSAGSGLIGSFSTGSGLISGSGILGRPLPPKGAPGPTFGTAQSGVFQRAHTAPPNNPAQGHSPAQAGNPASPSSVAGGGHPPVTSSTPQTQPFGDISSIDLNLPSESSIFGDVEFSTQNIHEHLDEAASTAGHSSSVASATGESAGLDESSVADHDPSAPSHVPDHQQVPGHEATNHGVSNDQGHAEAVAAEPSLQDVASAASPADESTEAAGALAVHETSSSTGSALASPAQGHEMPEFPNQIAGVNRPELLVLNCTQEGVKFAFDSIWMEHPGFRVSFPQRCAFTGQVLTDEYVVRPLVFADRSQARIRSARDVEVKHEQFVKGTRSRNEVVNLMGKLEWLPQPFNLPLPYYVVNRSILRALECTTVSRREDGGITCEVTIPDGQAALEWLLRVNGATGLEYSLLEEAVGRLWSDAWKLLADKTRERLTVWCAFEPMESFKLFVSDAEFSKKDLGLGGIVITDRRLIYCKYKVRGDARFSSGGIVQLVTEGDYAIVTLKTPEHNKKIVKVMLDDLPAIMKVFKNTGALKLQIG